MQKSVIEQYVSIPSTLFAATSSEYNCPTEYGAGTYGGCIADTNQNASSNQLANTGYDIILPLVIGAILITAAGVYFAKVFKSRIASKK